MASLVHKDQVETKWNTKRVYIAFVSLLLTFPEVPCDTEGISCKSSSRAQSLPPSWHRAPARPARHPAPQLDILDKALPGSPGWPWTNNSPASVSAVLVSQEAALIMPGFLPTTLQFSHFSICLSLVNFSFIFWKHISPVWPNQTSQSVSILSTSRLRLSFQALHTLVFITCFYHLLPLPSCWETQTVKQNLIERNIIPIFLSPSLLSFPNFPIYLLDF